MTSIFGSSLVDTAEHHPMLRKSVAQLVGRYGRPYFQGLVARDEKPVELWREMGEAGFLGVAISEQWGGGGGGLGDYSIVVEETAAQGCPLLGLVLSSICAPFIEHHGSEEMKKKWLPGIASGKLRLAFAITEPNAGTNTHKVTTTATKDGNGWRLNGNKYYTSALDEVDAMVVVARGDKPDATGRHPLSLFLVDVDAPGITFHPIPAVLMVPEKQFTLFFDNVKLGPEALIGKEGEGMRNLFVGLNPERVSAASLNNGIAKYAIEKGAQYASERSVWKTPIGAHQGLAHPLATAYIAVQQARLMTARAAQLYDQGSHEAGEAANMAKFAAADASLVALDQAIQIHGGNGFAIEYGLGDLWFIARLHKTAPVSREMILNFIAQHSLGLPKSY
jgi:alkylation response protein AidB-like acyl-CoA dehydrogenase